jgi:hypothetical protein
MKRILTTLFFVIGLHIALSSQVSVIGGGSGETIVPVGGGLSGNTPRLVANTAAGSTNGNDVTTSAIDTTGATEIFLIVSSTTATAEPVLSDNKTSTWSRIVTQTQATNNMRLVLWGCDPCVVGTGHTFSTANLLNSVPGIAALAFDSAFFPYTSASGSAVSSLALGTTSTVQRGVTLTVAGLNLAASRTVSIDDNFTLVDTVAFAAGQHYGLVSAYKLSNHPAVIAPSWSWTGGTTSSVAVRGTQ